MNPIGLFDPKVVQNHKKIQFRQESPTGTPIRPTIPANTELHGWQTKRKTVETMATKSYNGHPRGELAYHSYV